MLAIITILSTVVSAAPSRLQRRSFKVHHRRNEFGGSRGGLDAMHRAYRKFGFPLPDTLPTARQATVVGAGGGTASNTTHIRVADGSASNNPTGAARGPVSNVAAAPSEGDAEFLSPVTIGGQAMQMNFDTGSSDL